MTAYPSHNCLIPISLLPVSWWVLYLLPTYSITSRTAAHTTRQKLAFSVLNHERDRKAIISSGGDSKDFGDNRNFSFKQLWVTSWIGNASRNLNRARNLVPMLPLLMVTYELVRGGGGISGLKDFFVLNSLLPTALDNSWAQTHLPLLSGVGVHKAQLFWSSGTIIISVNCFLLLKPSYGFLQLFLFSSS